MHTTLTNYLKQNPKELLIWDFDKVIYTLDWYYGEPIAEFFERIYGSINEIDSTVIKDKELFFSSIFPYPEINVIGQKYGKVKMEISKQVLFDKEFSITDIAIPHNDTIDFIKASLNTFKHAIWSNNHSKTIEYLLKKADIEDRIDYISSYDKFSFAKPNSEGFELIRSHFPNIPISNMLMIGDSLRSDKVGAERAGIDFFHYLHTSGVC